MNGEIQQIVNSEFELTAINPQNNVVILKNMDHNLLKYQDAVVDILNRYENLNELATLNDIEAQKMRTEH